MGTIELKNVREARCWKRQFVEIRLPSDIFYKVVVAEKLIRCERGELWERNGRKIKILLSRVWTPLVNSYSMKPRNGG